MVSSVVIGWKFRFLVGEIVVLTWLKAGLPFCSKESIGIYCALGGAVYNEVCTAPIYSVASPGASPHVAGLTKDGPRTTPPESAGRHFVFLRLSAELSTAFVEWSSIYGVIHNLRKWLLIAFCS